jgi:hypothetical protein
VILNPVFENVVWTSTLTRIVPGIRQKKFHTLLKIIRIRRSVVSVTSPECRHPVSDPCTWQRRHGCKCMGQDRWRDYLFVCLMD